MFVLHKRVAHLRFPSYRLPRYIVGDPYKILRKTQRKYKKSSVRSYDTISPGFIPVSQNDHDSTWIGATV